MNIEENRLRTFSDWPSDAVVSPARIAKAGFYSINQGLIVECFCCHVQISSWSYGDQVMARHRTLNPNCPFVLDSSTSGNVPILQSQLHPQPTFVTSIDVTEPDSPTYEQLYINENMRLQSFINWPSSHIITPESLARAGFYYLNRRDKTKCAYCHGVVVDWKLGDNADEEHKRHFPNCSFVQSVINPRLEQLQRNQVTENGLPYTNVNVVSQNNLDELGINTHRGPKNSRYATLESRLQTFEAWPDDLLQTPDTLAQAGFYYERYGDQVRCFHCGGGLRHWDPHDDPWTEHARWFPKCAYVLLVKGQEFIRACHGDSDFENLEQERKFARPLQQRREVTEQDIQLQMTSPQVLTALSIGLHVGRIKQAIKEKLERTGTGFPTADAVIEAALNIQHEEESDSTHISYSEEQNHIASSLLDVLRTIHEAPATPVTNDAVQVSASSSEEQQTSSDVNVKPAESRQPKKSLSLEEENRLLKEARMCKICMDNEVGIVFLPCGHLTTCVNCAPNLKDCPVCRCSIKATVRTFLS